MFLFVLVCIMLLGIILLQSSKGGGLGAAGSGQSMNEALGGEGADKLMVKLTRILALVFMVLAVWIGKNNNSKQSLVDEYGGANGTESLENQDAKSIIQEQLNPQDTTSKVK